jgi:hypothetical protein
MKGFQIECEGRRLWLDPEITVNVLKRVKRMIDVDLAYMHEGDPPLAARLSVDCALVCDVLYCVLKTELDREQITDEQFGESLGGEALGNAQAALFEALTDFFQKWGRTEQAAMLRAQAKLTKALIEQGTREIERVPIPSISGNGSISLPESSESTPDPLQSENLCGWPREPSATNGTAPL